MRHALDCSGQGQPSAPAIRVPLEEGQITEEASFAGKYTEPAIQLLAYEGGGQGIRFCYYSLDGRFQRSPMMIDSEDSLEGLREALKSAPELRALIRKLVSWVSCPRGHRIRGLSSGVAGKDQVGHGWSG